MGRFLGLECFASAEVNENENHRYCLLKVLTREMWGVNCGDQINSEFGGRS